MQRIKQLYIRLCLHRDFLLVGSVYCCFSWDLLSIRKLKRITRLIFYPPHINQHPHALTLVLEVDEI